MTPQMKVTILTIEGIKFEGAAKFVRLILPDGQLGIMRGYEPSRILLEKGEISIDGQKFWTPGGFAEVTRASGFYPNVTPKVRNKDTIVTVIVPYVKAV